MPRNNKDAKGPTLVQYALMVMGIAIAIIAVVKLLNNTVTTAPDSAAKNVDITTRQPADHP
jgi:Flp pilus assembly pilin Flp